MESNKTRSSHNIADNVETHPKSTPSFPHAHTTRARHHFSQLWKKRIRRPPPTNATTMHNNIPNE